MAYRMGRVGKSLKRGCRLRTAPPLYLLTWNINTILQFLLNPENVGLTERETNILIRVVIICRSAKHSINTSWLIGVVGVKASLTVVQSHPGTALFSDG